MLLEATVMLMTLIPTLLLFRLKVERGNSRIDELYRHTLHHSKGPMRLKQALQQAVVMLFVVMKWQLIHQQNREMSELQ
jgi:hypothetical protein